MRITKFVVNEIRGDYGSGECTHFTLMKEGWNTISAINAIARKLGVRAERFGYAGLKDKNAITTQRVSAWRIPPRALSKLRIRGIIINDFEEGKERIRIGTHKGNNFEITIKNLVIKREPINVPNLFGPQRFNGTELLGRGLINEDYEGVINLLRNNEKGVYERTAIREYERSGNALRALRTINKRIRVLWVNSWQAYEWNNNIDLTRKVMPLRSYPMIKGMPELGSFPGGDRDTIMRVSGFRREGDTIMFSLGKGSYATTLINYITKD